MPPGRGILTRLGLWRGLWLGGLGACLGLAGCAAGQPVIEPLPLPPAEKLQAGDCPTGAEHYRQRLRLPPRAGSVVTTHPTSVPSEEEQERLAADFTRKCQAELVGRARRLIVRCWSDAPDAETLLGCNQRF